ncbi:pseudaminic acid synthase [Clostridiaceae bacterium M8S5]|nr:pseudaminic acid synthase [Clostridiaceae bacterium M8S5]
MNKTIKIKDRIIGIDFPAYMIAEMSANHAGEITRAIEIIHAAKEAGADCIKIQTYTPDTMTIDCDNQYFKINKGTWKGENLYNLYKKAYTPWEWQARLKEEADKIGIDFLSTPFDKTAVDFLEELGVDFYKIASFEIVDIPLIKYIASKGKPIIMSTGMASLGEIETAVNTIREQGIEELCLLKCSSAYPAIPKDMNLKTINQLKTNFDVIAGLSDHSLGSIGAITAIALGASVIEKHFCLSREIKNPDSSFSMEPLEFKQMVEDIRSAEKAIGKVSFNISDNEKSSSVFRRSIFIVKDMKKGETFSEENIRVIRPGYGLAPKYYEGIIGKIASVDIKRGTPLKWEMVM